MTFPVFLSQPSEAPISKILDLSKLEDVVDVVESLRINLPWKGDLLCDLCFYFSAEDEHAIFVHNVECHKVPEHGCIWPCWYESLPNADSLETHIRRWHETEEYICPVNDYVGVSH